MEISRIRTRTTILSAFALLFVFAFFGRAEADAIFDDFDDGVLDASLWETETAAVGFVKAGSVVEAGGVVTLTNRGALNTVQEFEPSPSNPVTIGLDFSFVSGQDILFISTRTLGDRSAPNGQSTTGIDVVIHSTFNGSVSIRELSSGATLGDAFGVITSNINNSAVIVDDGDSISVSVNGGHVITVPTSLSFPTNRVSIRNRESRTDFGDPTRIGEIDNVSISQPLSGFVCAGFEPPMDTGPVRVKKNRVLPLKAELLDTGDFPVTDVDILAPPVVQVLLESGMVGDPIDVTDDVLSAGQGTEGNQFVFTDENKWQFNLKTKNYTAPGTYTISMETGDDLEYGIDPTCATSFVIE